MPDRVAQYRPPRTASRPASSETVPPATCGQLPIAKDVGDLKRGSGLGDVERLAAEQRLQPVSDAEWQPSDRRDDLEPLVLHVGLQCPGHYDWGRRLAGGHHGRTHSHANRAEKSFHRVSAVLWHDVQPRRARAGYHPAGGTRSTAACGQQHSPVSWPAPSSTSLRACLALSRAARRRRRSN